MQKNLKENETTKTEIDDYKKEGTKLRTNSIALLILCPLKLLQIPLLNSLTESTLWQVVLIFDFFPQIA